MKRNKFFFYTLLICGLSLLAESCATGKKGCGCGTDINRAAKMPKRYH
jgi:hypothetical protein